MLLLMIQLQVCYKSQNKILTTSEKLSMLYIIFLFPSGVWMRSTRTAPTPTPPPATTTPTQSTSAPGTRTTSTLRTGNCCWGLWGLSLQCYSLLQLITLHHCVLNIIEVKEKFSLQYCMFCCCNAVCTEFGHFTYLYHCTSHIYSYRPCTKNRGPDQPVEHPGILKQYGNMGIGTQTWLYKTRLSSVLFPLLKMITQYFSSSSWFYTEGNSHCSQR